MNFDLQELENKRKLVKKQQEELLEKAAALRFVL